MPTCSHTDSHMHGVLMSLLVGSYHTFSVNLLSVPAACGLEIPGHVAKRQVPILFSSVAMVKKEGGACGTGTGCLFRQHELSRAIVCIHIRYAHTNKHHTWGV